MIDIRIEQRIKKTNLSTSYQLILTHKILLQRILKWYQVSSNLSTPIVQPPTNLTEYVNIVRLKDLINVMFKTMSQSKIKNTSN